MTTPVITPLPEPPNRADSPDDFSVKADRFLSSLPNFASELSEIGDFNTAASIAAADSAAAALQSEQNIESIISEEAANVIDQLETARDQAEVSASNAATSESNAANSASQSAQSAQRAANSAEAAANADIDVQAAADSAAAAAQSAEDAEFFAGQSDANNKIRKDIPDTFTEISGGLLNDVEYRERIEVKSTDFTAVNSFIYVIDMPCTITLPSTPLTGDFVVLRFFGEFEGSEVQASENIMGLSESLTVDTQNATLKLNYVNNTIGWILV